MAGTKKDSPEARLRALHRSLNQALASARAIRAEIAHAAEERDRSAIRKLKRTHLPQPGPPGRRPSGD